MKKGDRLSDGFIVDVVSTSIPEVDTGRYNERPPGLKEISAEEFNQHFIWCIEAMESRQVCDDPDHKSGYRLIMFHFNNGNGAALSVDYNYPKATFFRFGCKHEYRAATHEEIKANNISIFSSTHVRICEKCKFILVTDSSD